MMNARASGTNAGKPSAIGRTLFAAIRSASVPTRTFVAERAPVGQTKLSIPASPSSAAAPTATPNDRRRSARREIPAVGR